MTRGGSRCFPSTVLFTVCEELQASPLTQPPPRATTPTTANNSDETKRCPSEACSPAELTPRFGSLRDSFQPDLFSDRGAFAMAATQDVGREEAGEKVATASPATSTDPSKPLCLIVLGMAGSGKTTFVQRLTADLYASSSAPFVVNLDPACLEVPFPANVDIRDTINYKEVMKQYGLGPNGAIVTSLNLFATKFDQVRSVASALAACLSLQRTN